MSENKFDENKANTEMDRYSRQIAAVGVEVMRGMMGLKVLVVGMRGVGVETAKDLILAGPNAVHVYDESPAKIEDLGANFYITPEHVENKISRAAATLGQLTELNPYVDVQVVSGELTTEVLQSYGCVIITKHLPKAEMFRINQACRTNKPAPTTFILAVNYGVTCFMFSDFGDAHKITDADGETVDPLIVESIDEFGGVTVATKNHGLDSGDRVTFTEVEGAAFLNDFKDGVKVKRMSTKIADMDSDGKQKVDSKGNPKFRTQTIFNKFQIDFSDDDEAAAQLAQNPWTGGGIVTYVKPTRIMSCRSLEDSLTNPLQDQFFIPHLDDERTYTGRGNQLHFALNAMFDFDAKHGRMPALHSQEDAAEMVTIANALNASRKAASDSPSLVADEIDADVITKFSLFCPTELSGFCAFLGGSVAQEVVKKFGKYTPVYQWLTSDYFELLPGGTTVPSDAQPTGSRYDHQISIFGQAIQDKICAQKWFLVGCGALGCEYIKAFAMMGLGAGPQGQVHVTDLDTIELSNLSRQFLFRTEHINKFKSTCAAQVAQKMNPDMNIAVHQTKVCDETENIFDDDFWNSLDGVWNALDNIHARHYTDGKCIIYGKPLLESGTEGTKANSSIHIPGKTMSYSDIPVQETGKIAACTLRNFPHLIVHCIEWARPRFESLYCFNAQQLNAFLADEKKFFAGLAKEPIPDGIKLLKELKNLLVKLEDRSFASCVRLAAEEFWTQYHIRIKDLIYCYPEDARNFRTLEDGSKLDTGAFWGGKKRFPQVSVLNYGDDAMVMDYLYSAANLFAFMFGIEHVRDRDAFAKLLSECDLKMDAWQPPKEQVDVSEEEKTDVAVATDDEQKEYDDLCAAISAMAAAKKPAPVVVADFEKDDDTNFHIDFITACSNRRAWNYRIQPGTRLKTKVIAGKIIAALASTTAMITGLTSLEFYKLVLGLEKDEKTNPYFDTNVNLGVSAFHAFASSDAKKAQTGWDEAMQCEIKAVPEGFTTWDFIKIDGDLTCAELFEILPKIHHNVTPIYLQKRGITDEDVKAGKGGELYNPEPDFPEQEALMETRGAMKVSEVYAEQYGEIAESRNFILLNVECEVDDDPVQVPPVMLRFRNPKA